MNVWNVEVRKDTLQLQYRKNGNTWERNYIYNTGNRIRLNVIIKLANILDLTWEDVYTCLSTIMFSSDVTYEGMCIKTTKNIPMTDIPYLPQDGSEDENYDDERYDNDNTLYNKDDDPIFGDSLDASDKISTYDESVTSMEEGNS